MNKIELNDTTSRRPRLIRTLLMSLIVTQMSLSSVTSFAETAGVKDKRGKQGESGKDRTRPPRTEPPRAKPPRAEPPRAKPPRRTEPPRAKPPRAEPPRAKPPRAEPPRRDDGRRHERDQRRHERENARRNNDRIERDRARHERDRRFAEREARRRQERIEDRRRREREIEDRRNYRRHVRQDFHNHPRRIPRHHYGDIHDRNRWAHRHSRWHDHYYRPRRPIFPIVIIEVPVRFPNYGDYWDRQEIEQLADSLEVLSSRLYTEAERELSADTAWNNQALSLMYDVTLAAQIYSDAVEQSRNVYSDTLYELFNLEEAITLATAHILCGDLSPRIRNSFSQMKYYVAELLWQYRVDENSRVTPMTSPELSSQSFTPASRSVSTFRNPVLENSDGETLACQDYSFRWARPHDEVYWAVADTNIGLNATSLIVATPGTSGRVGRNGIAGISDLVVYYSDGTTEDLVLLAEELRDNHLYKDGLRLTDERDRIELPLDSSKQVEAITMTADSWIAPEIDVPLMLTLKGDARTENRLR